MLQIEQIGSSLLQFGQRIMLSLFKDWFRWISFENVTHVYVERTMAYECKTILSLHINTLLVPVLQLQLYNV